MVRGALKLMNTVIHRRSHGCSQAHLSTYSDSIRHVRSYCFPPQARASPSLPIYLRRFSVSPSLLLLPLRSLSLDSPYTMFALGPRASTTVLFASLISALVFADSGSHDHLGRRHHGHAQRGLEKRFDNARFTFYDAGINACGSFDQPDGFVSTVTSVTYHRALIGGFSAADCCTQFSCACSRGVVRPPCGTGVHPPLQQWDGGSHCYKTITLNYKGKTAQAKITDYVCVSFCSNPASQPTAVSLNKQCVECPFAAIDLSRGLMEHMVGSNYEDIGQVYGEWDFGSGAAPPPPPPPPTTTTHKPKTTTTTHKPSTTTTSHKETTTSTTHSTSFEESYVPSSLWTRTKPDRQLVRALLQIRGCKPSSRGTRRNSLESRSVIVLLGGLCACWTPKAPPRKMAGAAV